MSAREQIIGLMAGAGADGSLRERCEAVADRILEIHAHELAEVQRAYAKTMGNQEWATGAYIAADLIDPEREVHRRECACDGETSLQVHTAVDCYDLPEVST
jgi:hypothetical protein